MAVALVSALPLPVDQVEPVIEQVLDEEGRILRVVGVVTVDQHIHIGVDIGKHAGNDMAFTLPPLVADDWRREGVGRAECDPGDGRAGDGRGALT